jgi:hypothetical protein
MKMIRGNAGALPLVINTISDQVILCLFHHDHLLNRRELVGFQTIEVHA